MKKTIAIVLAVAVVLTLGVGVVWASNGQPASKATAQVKDLTILEWTGPVVDGPTAWDTILEQNIKTPNQKDLFIDVSLESGLYTKTLVKSKRNYEGDPAWDTSTAHAKIDVRVLIDEGTADERVASPGWVVFNYREQTLSAKFMGIFTGECLEVNQTTGNVTINYTCLEPEELDLILDTMSANSFNFVIDQLTPGVHTISVQARIDANGSAEEGEFDARAIIGRGSVIIEVVRMIQGEDWLELPE